MRRINIQIRDDIDPFDAIERVADVMRTGRISGEGRYYCWASRFTDGTTVVTRGPNKVIATSDSFIVYKEKKP